MTPVSEKEFRLLPSVDEVLQQEAVAALLEQIPRPLVVEAVRETLSDLREAFRQDRAEEARRRLERLGAEVAERARAGLSLSFREVINATGVVLHTNLGRAPLSRSALEAIRQTAGGYSNLEYDLGSGARGRRDIHAAALLERLLGAPAIVVNNNAAAIFLALNELAAPGEVIISRGELVEIGEGFRIPDILARSGARMREVGATNRTSVEDYRAAIHSETRALLRVHRSNFRLVGFTSRPSLAELVELARQAGLPLIEDLGSGCLVDLRRFGLEHEPEVGESLAAGVEVVTFSGDKLLGGPQAGILAGNRESIARIRRNPLFRALRVDKLTYAALGATLRDYLLGNWRAIPALAMLAEPAGAVRERAAALVGRLTRMEADLADGASLIGGGSTPALEVATTLITLRPPPGVPLGKLESRLREGPTPVVGRVEKDRLVLDLRTVFPEQEPVLAEMLLRAWKDETG